MKTDTQILDSVVLHEDVPPGINEPAASRIRQAIEAGRDLAIAKVRVAKWPDGIWALLAFNPEWPGPRNEQIVRAYRTADAAGIRMNVQ